MDDSCKGLKVDGWINGRMDGWVQGLIEGWVGDG